MEEGDSMAKEWGASICDGPSIAIGVTSSKHRRIGGLRERGELGTGRDIQQLQQLDARRNIYTVCVRQGLSRNNKYSQPPVPSPFSFPETAFQYHGPSALDVGKPIIQGSSTVSVPTSAPLRQPYQPSPHSLLGLLHLRLFVETAQPRTTRILITWP